MAEITSFRDLNAWQMAMKLVEQVYVVSGKFPDTERYGLIAQIRRAAVSVPSNIAEGQGAGGGRWSLRHIRIAIGSLAETETQLEIAFRLRYAVPSACAGLLACIEDTRRLLYGMRRERMRRLGITVTRAILLFFVAGSTSL